MSNSIPNLDCVNQLENAIRQFVKEKLELIMKEEIQSFLEIDQRGTSNRRNGYYHRNLDTQYGRIEGLSVPRDRNGEFQTQLFTPYQRHTPARGSRHARYKKNGQLALRRKCEYLKADEPPHNQGFPVAEKALRMFGVEKIW
jgi:hypothetical protein